MLEIEPCTPPLWARGGHAQTLFGTLIPSLPLKWPVEKIEIPLPDGDVLVADEIKGDSNLVVYLFHGLTGDGRSNYMERSANVFSGLGHSVWLVNHRGCGAGKGKATRPYHSGRGEDLSSAIALGRRRFPNKRHLAIGFSLGGSALLNLLTGRRGDTLPDAAISVNAPIDLKLCARVLHQGFNRVYETGFLLNLRRELAMRGDGNFELWKKLLPPMRLMDFDDVYTAPRSGFRDREHYYAECSTFAYLDQITTPTILLTAADDPFIAVESYQAAKLSPQVLMHIEPTGGHLGYLQAHSLGLSRWLDRALEVGARHLLGTDL